MLTENLLHHWRGDKQLEQEKIMPATVKSSKTIQKRKPVLSVKSKKTSAHTPNQDYQEMIAEAAYYKAEQRGFIPGFEKQDWLDAENEILAMLKLH